jgi:phosphoribosyl 1,2-cyclic phosphate phosphodiesterase
MGEAIILGSGTSNGVPMLGYRYPAGYLDQPKNHRTRSSLLLVGPDGNVLIDCAPEMRLQLTREGIYELEAVIVTHTHADHIMGMDDLRSLCMIYNRAMPIFTLPEHGEDIRRIFHYAFVTPPQGIVYPKFELHEMPARLDLAGMSILGFVVEHGSTRVIGIRVNDFAYITDVSFVPPQAEELLYGLDTLVVDGLRFRPHPNHFNVEAALAFRERVSPKRTILTHLTHDFDHEVTEATLPEDVKLAFDGMRIAF